MKTMTTGNESRVRRAYTIVWFTDPVSKEKRVLNGREVAVHAKALSEFHESAGEKIYNAIVNEEPLIGADGSNRELGIQRNLSGVLMIGRSALPGGRIDRGETPVQAARRELYEEMDVSEALEKFTLLSTEGENAFYTLDLTEQITEFPEWLADHIRDFKPNSDKRELEVVTPQQLIEQLEAPDERDGSYIAKTMRSLAHNIALTLAKKLGKPEPSFEPIWHLAVDLTHYQLARTLQPHADAVRKFLNE